MTMNVSFYKERFFLAAVAGLFLLTYSTSYTEAAARKCPVFECLPYLLSTDLTKVSELFNYNAIIGVTVKNDSGIEHRQAAIKDVCTSYTRFDTCFGGNWWECFDIAELLQVAKEAFSYLKLPGGGELSQLTEKQVTVGLKVAQYACANWDKALNNSYCIRAQIVRNVTLYNYFVQAGYDMGARPETITCGRFRQLFHLFVYSLSTRCSSDLANATNNVLTLGMQAIPNFNLSECTFMTYEEIMETTPDFSVLANITNIYIPEDYGDYDDATTTAGTTTTTAAAEIAETTSTASSATSASVPAKSVSSSTIASATAIAASTTIVAATKAALAGSASGDSETSSTGTTSTQHQPSTTTSAHVAGTSTVTASTKTLAVTSTQTSSSSSSSISTNTNHKLTTTSHSAGTTNNDTTTTINATTTNAPATVMVAVHRQTSSAVRPTVLSFTTLAIMLFIANSAL